MLEPPASPPPFTLAALEFPAIDPVIFELGPFALRWYALAYIAGLILGWRHILAIAPSIGSKVPPDAIDDFLVWATLGIILGGRFGYVLFYQFGYFTDNPLQIFYVWQGGMSFHGGLLGVAVAGYLFCRKRGIPFLALADLVACAAPIGLFFGRIANFVNGELWGRTTDVPWAFIFPRGGPFPRHPSQLYEAFLEGVVLFSLMWVARRHFPESQRTGFLIGVFLGGYGLFRTIAEAFREPDAHVGYIFGVLTLGQILSLPILFLGVWQMHRVRTRP
jgi:phosphatidylglycerol:prolipoprotein diacylglycerol transferase